MTIAVPSLNTAKKAGAWLLFLVLAALLLFGVGWLMSRVIPKRDPAPARAAQKDTVVARDTAQAIGTQSETRTRDANVHVDITTKEIRDAFDQLPPVPAPVAGAPAPDLPAAPVDRLRERLNEGIARANRAAGAADPAKRTDAP